MKLIILFFLILIEINPHTISFLGNYKQSKITENWKKNNKTRMGFVNGCIYNGKIDNKFIKVYSDKKCPTENQKNKMITCELFSTAWSGSIDENFMYEGECKIK